jgi:hypothetical protein
MQIKSFFLILLGFACLKASAQNKFSHPSTYEFQSSDKRVKNSELFRKQFMQMRSGNNASQMSNHLEENPAFSMQLRIQNFSTDTVTRVDSAYNWQWNSSSNSWVISGKIIYSYSANNNMINALSQVYSSGVWENSGLYIYSYDASDNLTAGVFQLWNGASWINNYQDLYTYNSYDSIVNYANQTWNGIAWVNSYQYIYTFDSNHDMISDVYQTWTGSSWTNNEGYIGTYDTNHNRLSWVYQQWVSGSWQNNYEYLYTYNLNNYLTATLEKYWDIDSVNWMNSSRTFESYDGSNNHSSSLTELWDGIAWFSDHLYSYTFDGSNNMTSEVYQIWDGISAWQNISRWVYTYDSNNNQTSATFQDWNTSNWVNNFQYINTYDADNNRVSLVYQSWNIGSWENSDSTFFYFNEHLVTGIAAAATVHEKITISPNPATTQFKILGNDLNMQEIHVYSVFGQEVFSSDAINLQDYIFDVSKWKAGMYFLRLGKKGGGNFNNYKLEIVH